MYTYTTVNVNRDPSHGASYPLEVRGACQREWAGGQSFRECHTPEVRNPTTGLWHVITNEGVALSAAIALSQEAQ